MLVLKDINRIVSKAYAKWSQEKPGQMRLIGNLLETVREQLGNPPVQGHYMFMVWDRLRLDEETFRNDDCITVLSYFRQLYFEQLMRGLMDEIRGKAAGDAAGGRAAWWDIYASAAVRYRDDAIALLATLPSASDRRKTRDKAYFLRFVQLLREENWVDTYPYFQEIAVHPDVSMDNRIEAEYVLGQIAAFSYPDYRKAEPHFRRVEELSPGHIDVGRGWGAYYMKGGDMQKARNYLTQVLTKDPRDHYTFNLIGDCFFYEQKLEEAESWYRDASRVNFLQADSYRRLIYVYCSADWKGDREQQLEMLAGEIRRIDNYPFSRQLFGREYAGCFCSTEYYQALREIGDAYLNLDGKLDMSRTWYKAAIKVRPQLLTAHNSMASWHIFQGQYGPATRQLRRLVKIDPDYFDAWWGLSAIEERKLDDSVLAIYEKCRTIRPSWGDWIDNAIGNYYYSRKDFATAIVSYKKALAKNSDFDIYLDNLALAYEMLGDQQAAAGGKAAAENAYLSLLDLKRTAANLDKTGNFFLQLADDRAISFLEQAVQLEPQNPIYITDLATAREGLLSPFNAPNNKVLVEVEEDLKKAIRLAQEQHLQDVRPFNALGRYYFRWKDYPRAIEAFGHALQLFPGHATLLYNLGYSYRLNKEPQKGIDLLKTSPGSPRDSELCNLLGLLFEDVQDFTSAGNAYREAMTIDPSVATYHFNVANNLQHFQKTEEAIEELKSAIHYNKNYDAAYNALASLYFDKGDLTRSLHYLEKALALMPYHVDYISNRVSLAMATAGKEGKLAKLRQLAGKYPKNDFMNEALGNAFMSLEEYKDALACYRKALDRSPDDYKYQNNLANAYAMDGQLKKAIAGYLKLYVRTPDQYGIALELGRHYRSLGDNTTGDSWYATALATLRALQQRQSLDQQTLKTIHDQYPDFDMAELSPKEEVGRQ